MAFESATAAREVIKLPGGGSIEGVRITLSGTSLTTSSTQAITWASVSGAEWLASESVLYLRDFAVAVTAGSATTSSPTLGTSASPAGLGVIASQTVAQGAAGRDVTLMRSPVSFAPGSAIYFLPALDAGSDNAVSLSLLITREWGP